MYKHFVWISALAFGSATAVLGAPKQQAAGSDKSATRITCATERVTGSHIPKRVCMTDEERERRRQRDQDEMERLRKGPGRGPSPGQE